MADYATSTTNKGDTSLVVGVGSKGLLRRLLLEIASSFTQWDLGQSHKLSAGAWQLPVLRIQFGKNADLQRKLTFSLFL